MFIEVSSIKNGDLVHKYVNLSTVSVMQEMDLDDRRNIHGHKTVLFTTNGYALYSYASIQEIIQKVEG